ncbi:hypothetical protein BU17DRAFT_95008 [Hysterangium stoloniferum]|nr:hypothetical protein BU17DRAFT_95008 [Hysterangium stoloniferum]
MDHKAFGPPKEPPPGTRILKTDDANVLLDDEAGQHRSIIFKRQSLIKTSGNPPHLPSSQEAEVELLINLDNDSSAASDETNPLPAASAQPSPSKARAISIIARIKANAEIQAAAQAQQEQNLSLLGSTDDGSDLSDPKMDSLSRMSRKACRSNEHVSAHTNEANTRRSTRHLPNRDVKVELFRDDSPGPSTPRTTFKAKPNSNVACPLDTLLKDNRREEARKARVERKRGTKGWAAEASGSDDFSNTPGDGSEEPLMCDEAREALSDEEDAEAVGMILKEDVVEVENGITFAVQLRVRCCLDRLLNGSACQLYLPRSPVSTIPERSIKLAQILRKHSEKNTDIAKNLREHSGRNELAKNLEQHSKRTAQLRNDLLWLLSY